mmetsp:Transcript_68865/g.191777  ORF Transcript_68865/g.191777 Transcript_68865/m.191777 type:complete len:254 (+) Transcript_68865:2448-3209(+)
MGVSPVQQASVSKVSLECAFNKNGAGFARCFKLAKACSCASKVCCHFTINRSKRSLHLFGSGALARILPPTILKWPVLQSCSKSPASAPSFMALSNVFALEYCMYRLCDAFDGSCFAPDANSTLVVDVHRKSFWNVAFPNILSCKDTFEPCASPFSVFVSFDRAGAGFCAKRLTPMAFLIFLPVFLVLAFAASKVLVFLRGVFTLSSARCRSTDEADVLEARSTTISETQSMTNHILSVGTNGAPYSNSFTLL